jgi:lambda repressor-like predicted transcriptional regulator
MRESERRLPARPLQTALREMKQSHGSSWDQLAIRLGVCSRTLIRVMKATDVSYVVADRMACRLGSHPSLLWPKEWSN